VAALAGKEPLNVPPIADNKVAVYNLDGSKRYEDYLNNKIDSDYLERSKALSVKNINTNITRDNNGILNVCFSNYIGDAINYRLSNYNGNDLTIFNNISSGTLVSPYFISPNFTRGIQDASVPNHYAYTVGAKLTFSILGTGFWFFFLSDSRGGGWKFSVLDSTETQNISTYSASAKQSNKAKIFGNLPDGFYNIEAEFMGDDPENTPSSGAGTSRGWFRFDPNDPVTIRETKFKYGVISPYDEIQAVSAINEFAIYAKRADDSGVYGKEWVPRHTTNSSSSARNITQVLLVDGKEMAGSISVFGINEVILEQEYTAFNFQDVNGDFPMWDAVLTHKLKNGFVTISHSIKLNYGDVNVDQMFLSQMGVFIDKTPRLNYFNTSYDMLAVPESITIKKFDSSFIFLGDELFVSGSVNLAGSLSDISKSEIRIVTRADGFGKIYYVNSNNYSTISSGTEFNTTNSYLVGKLINKNSIL